MGFPSGSMVKNQPEMQELQETQIRSLGQRDSPGGGHGNSFQYSCLENPKDRGAWWAMVHGVTKSPNATEATEHAGSTMGGTDKNQ